MKSMKRPTEHAILISELVMLIFDVKPNYDKVTKTYDYWQPALKLYGSKNFINDI